MILVLVVTGVKIVTVAVAVGEEVVVGGVTLAVPMPMLEIRDGVPTSELLAAMVVMEDGRDRKVAVAGEVTIS